MKVGDRVRIVGACMTGGIYENGNVGVITSPSPVNSMWIVDINGDYAHILESEMEVTMDNRLKGLKLKWDVRGNDDLRNAIIGRVNSLGGVTPTIKWDYLYLNSFSNNGILSGSNHRDSKRHYFHAHENKLATLDDLYHPPKPKATLTTPDGKTIELSDETWESWREAME